LKVFDKIWNMLGLIETEDTEDAAEPATPSAPRMERRTDPPARNREEMKARHLSTPESKRIEISDTPAPPITARRPPSTASPSGAPAFVSGSAERKIVITQPNGFDDARQIAEHVTNRRTVVVNFEKTDMETIKRTVDFMSGITYAVGGTVQRISGTIFLFAPNHVDVFSSDQGERTGLDLSAWIRP
jgi:FtsZ-interacting cell division protein YlmF